MSPVCPFCGARGGPGGRAPGYVDVGMALLFDSFHRDEKAARTFVGKMISDYGQGPTACAIGLLSVRMKDKTQEPLAEPVSYILGLLKQRKGNVGAPMQLAGSNEDQLRQVIAENQAWHESDASYTDAERFDDVWFNVQKLGLPYGRAAVRKALGLPETEEPSGVDPVLGW